MRKDVVVPPVSDKALARLRIVGRAYPSTVSWDMLSLVARVDFEIAEVARWKERAEAWETRCDGVHQSLDASIAEERTPGRLVDSDNELIYSLKRKNVGLATAMADLVQKNTELEIEIDRLREQLRVKEGDGESS